MFLLFLLLRLYFYVCGRGVSILSFCYAPNMLLQYDWYVYFAKKTLHVKCSRKF